MSEVDAAQSSKAQALILLLSGAMTLNRQVISSTSSPHFDGATYVVLPFSFGVSGLVLASLCNSV